MTKEKIHFVMLNVAISYMISLVSDIANMLLMDSGKGILAALIYLFKMIVLFIVMLWSEEKIRDLIKRKYFSKNNKEIL